MIDEAQRAYDRIARDLYATELRIASIGHRAQGGVDAKILPSLIAKRDRLAIQAIDLKIAADATKPNRLNSREGSDITLSPRKSYPAGTLIIEDIAGPLPDFLKRSER